MKILALAGSMRADSFNRKLLAIAVEIAEREGATVDRADPRMLDVPLYDGDVETASGPPPGALALSRLACAARPAGGARRARLPGHVLAGLGA